MILETIEKENDIKLVDREQWPALAQEIRDFLISKISVTGGHLASNLGTVELTMALHLSLELPKDKIIWDVGHQAYTHKILTGRQEGFDSLRQYKGMSGFPKRKESDCDVFETGHSTTSISAGLGMVKARDILGQDYSVVAVIGDGSLTGGMAYEAMNNAAKMETNFIVILNDNNMSISENVGGVSKYLNNIRTTSGYLDLKQSVYNAMAGSKRGNNTISKLRKVKSSFKHLVIPGMLFEDMGLTYLGPVDGHDIDAMMQVIAEAKRVNGPVLIHALTEKGKGYEPAEKHPSRFHGIEPFDIETGYPLKEKTEPGYTEVFSKSICKLAEADDKIVAITAAMPDGTGLKRFRKLYPERFFDVGIAEEHAVTFAGGLAAGGLKPVVAIYSSFLQRSYDQMIHDICMQDLPVVFAIDRAGLVGSDGETHQGVFDLSFLSSMPNMTVCAPKNRWELAELLKFAVNYNKPIAIRYPRGVAYGGLKEYAEPITAGKAEWIYEESEVALFAVGSMVQTAEVIREKLKNLGYSVSLINARFVKPIDEEAVLKAAENHSLIVTLEENVASGGYGEKVLELLNRSGKSNAFLPIAIPDMFVEHGNTEVLKEMLGIDAESITGKISSILPKE